MASRKYIAKTNKSARIDILIDDDYNI